MMKNVLLALALLSASLLTGCATGGGGHSGHDIVVDVNTNPANQPNVGVTLTVQFKATVTNTTSTAVTWSVTSSDCTGSACGTINGSGLYTAPDTAPADGLSVKIVATLTSDTTKTGSYSIEVLPITVILTPKLSSGDPVAVARNTTQQFTATANPDAAPQTMEWEVFCDAGGNSCGTIDQNGLFTAAAAVPNPPTGHISATSTIDPTGVDLTDIIIVKSRLAGNSTYAFRFSGFDASGAIAVAGNFTTNADGTAITGGIEDDLTVNQYTNPTISGGNLDLNTGTNDHGVLTMNTSAGTRKYNIALDADGDGRMIEFDSTGRQGSGQIAVATPGKFKESTLLGGSTFAFGLSGVTTTGTQRAGFVGLVKPNGAGAINSGMLDRNENGVTGNANDITGTYTIDGTSDPHPGRGTMTLTSGNLGKTYHYAIYMIGGLTTQDKNPLTMYAISTDDPQVSPAVSGSIVFQDPTISYTTSDFKDFFVTSLTGVNSGGHTLVSLTNGNGDGASKLNGTMYANNAGTIQGALPRSPLAITSYPFASAGSGKYTLDLLSPAVHFVLYSTASSRGFLLSTSGTVVYTGQMDQQSPKVFAPAELAGSFAASTVNAESAAGSHIVMNLLFNSAAPNFTVSGKQDVSDGGPTAGQSLSGTYTLDTDSKGSFVLTPPATSSYAIFPLDNPKQSASMIQHFVMIDLDTANTDPSIIFAER